MTHSESPGLSHAYRRWWWLCLVLLLAFGLRLYALDAQSIWWDEGISLNLARSPLTTLLRDRLDNIHPPLYFIWLKGWSELVGLGAFHGRYLSVLASLLQVALGYAVCRRWFKQQLPKKRQAAWGAGLALFFISISPLSVVYGQEIRVYAMLPVATLGLLAIGQLLASSRANGRHLLAFAVVEWIGLHLHYVMAFTAVYVSLWLLVSYYRHGRWFCLRRFMLTQIGVGLACLPWFAALLLNWTAVQAEANAGTYIADPVPLDFLLKQVWVFHHTGLAGMLAVPAIWPLALALLGLTAVLYGLHLSQPQTRLTASHYLWQWLLPLAAALSVWTVRSFSHPRYIAFAAINFIPLVAYLLVAAQPSHGRWRYHVGQGLAMVMGGLLLLLSVSGLHAYFFDARHAKDDMRGLAAHLQANLSPNDLIIVPDAGWAFHFEYGGHTPVVMPQFAQPGLDGRLQTWIQPSADGQARHIALLAPSVAPRDWQGLVPFALETAGSLVETRPFKGLVLQTYQIDQPFSMPPLTPTNAQFGSLQLMGVWVQPTAVANTAVTVALQWQRTEATSERYNVVLTPIDEQGMPQGQQGSILVDSYGRPTEQWAVGERVTTTHTLPLPLGTVPQTWHWRLGVNQVLEGEVKPVEVRNANGARQGVYLQLAAETVLLPPLFPGANPYNLPPQLPRWPQPLPVGTDLSVTAVGQDRDQVQGGQTMQLSVEWLVHHSPSPQPWLLQLRQGEQLLWQTAVGSRYPLAQWQAGQQLVEHHLLRLPADVMSGVGVFVLSDGAQMLPIAQVEIVTALHDYSPPSAVVPVQAEFADVARLVGFDPPPTAVGQGEAVPLTLYWQAMRSDVSVAYTVFVHLLAADGRLIGQHDAPPVAGQRPTTGWLSDEYIGDQHIITIHEESAYEGVATVAVGLYDPQTGARVPLADGSDAFYLSVEIDVVKEHSP